MRRIGEIDLIELAGAAFSRHAKQDSPLPYPVDIGESRHLPAKLDPADPGPRLTAVGRDLRSATIGCQGDIILAPDRERLHSLDVRHRLPGRSPIGRTAERRAAALPAVLMRPGQHQVAVADRRHDLAVRDMTGDILPVRAALVALVETLL